MRRSVPCPVCRSRFLVSEPLLTGQSVRCRVCGAKLLVSATEPELETAKFPQDPGEEITDRIEAFARLHGYVFDDNRELVVQGLVEKHGLVGDFFCPCRLEDTPDYICPCLETRQSRVRKDGQCRCGLFICPPRTDTS